MPADDFASHDGWTPGGSGRAEVAAADRWRSLREFFRELLPLGVRDARLDPGPRSALLVAGLALLAAVAALVVAWLSAAKPAPSPGVVAPKVSVPPLAGASPSAAASSAAPGVVVEVVGKVRHPGLVKLPAAARVADAVAAAGGALPGVSTQGLSLARRLVDGEQLLVGLPQPQTGGAPGPAASAGGPSEVGPVNLNTATLDDLDGLPGIGPVLAQRILDWRSAHGPFTSVDQLRDVSGLGGKKFDAIASLVRV